MAVAGGLAGRPMRVTRAKTVDLEIPADSEIVIEGLIDTDLLAPEGPFGESHGHVALEDFNMSMRVTAITMKTKPIFAPSAAMRMSIGSVIVMPTPTAGPLIAAITGLSES